MKKIKKVFSAAAVAAAVIASLMLSAPFAVEAAAVSSGYGLSSGLEILKSKSEIKKCGVCDSPISFSSGDFDSIIGKADFITLMTLPDKAAGKLVLGGRDVTAGQTVTRRSLNEMKYEPCRGTTSEASFTFCDAAGDGTKYGVCTLYILEKPNLPPAPKDSSFDTQKNISYKGFLGAADPENDNLTFSIVSSAKHGIVQLIDKASGFFMYTPKAEFTGRDIFSFRVTDAYGNRSDSLKVTIHVTEPETNITFSDMVNHWAHNSAIKAVSDGLFGCGVQDGKLVFNPELDITRGDFLAVSMIAAGLEKNIEKTGKTAFCDDADIPVNIKSYAQAALEWGIITGYAEAGGEPSFRSTAPISRSEASLILSRLLSLPENTENMNSASSVFGNTENRRTLSSCGIFVGVGGGEMLSDTNLTRAQAAQIYCNIKDYNLNLTESK